MSRKFIQLPTSRVRQVCALDDQFKLISKDALLLITKATELFVTDLAGTAGKVAKQQGNRKTILLQDIINVATYIDKFHFIKDSKLPALNPVKAENDELKRNVASLLEDKEFKEMEDQTKKEIEEEDNLSLEELVIE